MEAPSFGPSIWGHTLPPTQTPAQEPPSVPSQPRSEDRPLTPSLPGAPVSRKRSEVETNATPPAMAHFADDEEDAELTQIVTQALHTPPPPAKRRPCRSLSGTERSFTPIPTPAAAMPRYAPASVLFQTVFHPGKIFEDNH